MNDLSFDAIMAIDRLYLDLSVNTEKAMCIISDLEQGHLGKDELTDPDDEALFKYSYKEIATKVSIVSDYLFNIQKLTSNLENFLISVSKEKDENKSQNG